MLFWDPLSTFTCLIYLLHDCVMYYTARNSPPVGFTSICINISTLPQSFSYLIPLDLPTGGNKGIFWPLLYKLSNALPYGVVDMQWSEIQKDPPFMCNFTGQLQGLVMIPHIISLFTFIIGYRLLWQEFWQVWADRRHPLPPPALHYLMLGLSVICVVYLRH